MAGKTLYDKLWEQHLVLQRDDGTALIYIDRQLIHEVTSPQAFEGLRISGRKPWRAAANIATPDHNVPTTTNERKAGLDGIEDRISRIQIKTLDDNCDELGITEFKINDLRQGIVHVVGPEQGATLPGMTVVCGDSHTSTHGAFGALAFGIGTSEVEHVLATQCLVQKKPKTMEIRVDGTLAACCSPKDVILAIIGKIGIGGGTGHVIEYTGSVIRSFSMEGRMTLCNMSIEGGARAGLVAPDDLTISYVQGRPLAPTDQLLEQAKQSWKTLVTDQDAHYDHTIEIRGEDIAPQVTWGTNPEMVAGIDENIPNPKDYTDEKTRLATEKALTYMDLRAGTPIQDIKIDRVFIGSCTNSRMEDLRIAAKYLNGKRIAKSVHAMVVPGSGLIKKQAEIPEEVQEEFNVSSAESQFPGCDIHDIQLSNGQVWSMCNVGSNKSGVGTESYGNYYKYYKWRMI